MTVTATPAPPSADPAALAAAYARDGAVHAVPAGVGRRWALLGRDDEHEAWVIAWPQGTGLAMHGHDGSSASVVVVAGRLRERFVTAERALVTRWLHADDAADLPGDHLHEIVNVDADEAVSVHVYSPPLREVRAPADELRWSPAVGG